MTQPPPSPNLTLNLPLNPTVTDTPLVVCDFAPMIAGAHPCTSAWSAADLARHVDEQLLSTSPEDETRTLTLDFTGVWLPDAACGWMLGRCLASSPAQIQSITLINAFPPEFEDEVHAGFKAQQERNRADDGTRGSGWGMDFHLTAQAMEDLGSAMEAGLTVGALTLQVHSPACASFRLAGLSTNLSRGHIQALEHALIHQQEQEDARNGAELVGGARTQILERFPDGDVKSMLLHVAGYRADIGPKGTVQTRWSSEACVLDRPRQLELASALHLAARYMAALLQPEDTQESDMF